jgi:hypothetical protein
MTASPGGEVDRNLLFGAALGCAQARANAQDAGGQDLGDLVEALGGGHQVGVEGGEHRRLTREPPWIIFLVDLARNDKTSVRSPIRSP